MNYSFCRITDENISLISKLFQIENDKNAVILDKALTEWNDSINKFDQKNEILLGIFHDTKCIGLGGVNSIDKDIGRLRRFYVSEQFRDFGIGTELLNKLKTYSKQHYSELQLFTKNPIASSFYIKNGFITVKRNNITHVLKLSESTTLERF